MQLAPRLASFTASPARPQRTACGAVTSCSCSPVHQQQRSHPVPVSAATDRAQRSTTSDAGCSRREAVLGAATLAAALAWRPQSAQAVQGLTAGRIPGISKEPDADGYLVYYRPLGKSGGHGVGWSEIPQYSFKVPQGWQETPVSIADLGGTEIDLRFASPDQGELSVVVAPVLRFMDVGYNADVRIEEIGDPDKLIHGFSPEIFGGPLGDDDVLRTDVMNKDGLTYYNWEVRPHHLVAMTAVKNRVFLLSVTANGRQWRKAQEQLRHIQASFSVPGAATA